MDVLSWIILAAVIVLSAVGVALWNRFASKTRPSDEPESPGPMPSGFERPGGDRGGIGL
ncbi:hypothetical protein [Agromyces sp. GXS1127]|uniref:hypothetical protein n=1 Tax=Agromyces sp. GXS1127 TaxID=3424181 RepID=UPI003D3244A5